MSADIKTTVAALTDAQIQDAVFAVLRKWNTDRAWDCYTRESGPYDVTSLRPEVLEIIRAVLARHAQLEGEAAQPSLQALENCRLYAARHRKEGWAKDILRLCADGGAISSPLRAVSEGEAARPDILERLTYHAGERDDLSLDDCLSYLSDGWKRIHGRTERQMVMQILALLASAPAAAEGEAAQPERPPRVTKGMVATMAASLEDLTAISESLRGFKEKYGLDDVTMQSEPVGYMDPSELVQLLGGHHAHVSPTPRETSDIPVYATAQPQAQPSPQQPEPASAPMALTDEVILEIWEDTYVQRGTSGIEFARAILERASSGEVRNG